MRQPLTPRESEILRHVIDGLMNKEIADREGISICTVKTHLHSVMLKTGCRTRTQLAVHALREGLRAA